MNTKKVSILKVNCHPFSSFLFVMVIKENRVNLVLQRRQAISSTSSHLRMEIKDNLFLLYLMLLQKKNWILDRIFNRILDNFELFRKFVSLKD